VHISAGELQSICSLQCLLQARRAFFEQTVIVHLGLILSFADHLGGGGVPPMLKGTARTLKITPESKYLCICFA
jgi:hypothetical protein